MNTEDELKIRFNRNPTTLRFFLRQRSVDSCKIYFSRFHYQKRGLDGLKEIRIY